MPRDVSLSDSKCWNGGQKWVNIFELYTHLVALRDDVVPVLVGVLVGVQPRHLLVLVQVDGGDLPKRRFFGIVEVR